MAKITIEIKDEDLAMLEDYIRFECEDKNTVNELVSDVLNTYVNALYRPKANEYHWFSGMGLIKQGIYYKREDFE